MNEPVAPQFSQERYLAWEAASEIEHELHHGFVFGFAGGTLEQNLLALRVRDLLVELFPAPCLTFTSDVKVKIARDLFFYPDVTVVCEAIDPKSAYIERPRIVVEVLSRATSGYDRVEKRAAYRSLPSLTTYVIVHSEIRRVEVDSRGTGDAWHTEVYDRFQSMLLGGADVPVADIYGSLVAE